MKKVIGTISSLKLECIEIEAYKQDEEAGITQMCYEEKPFGLYVETGHPMAPVCFEVSNEKVLIDFFKEFKNNPLNVENSLLYIDKNVIYFDCEEIAKYNNNSVICEDEEDLGYFFQHITSHFDK